MNTHFSGRLYLTNSKLVAVLVVVLAGIVFPQFASAATFPSGYTNTGSIANTRHNLSHSTNTIVGPGFHGHSRNQYKEVCVYCHTPHAANLTANGISNPALPLWNRTIKVTNYQTYDELGTSSLTQAVTSTPGAASLTCLSCHDGQTAIDSVINMPGSGMGLNSQDTTSNALFLDSWNNDSGVDTTLHRGLNSVISSSPIVIVAPIAPIPPFFPGFPGVTLPAGEYLGNGQGNDTIGCLTCHSPVGSAAVTTGSEGPDFRLFNLGTDLRNDHPIGVTYPPNGPGTDFFTPAGVSGTSNFFDDGDGKMEKAEIRTYDGKVECASCHDPHGVPGGGGVFIQTFLRKNNTNASAVCLTCHNK
ncbi:MAG: cytochrome c3 family protein [Gallionella sp.]